MSTFLANLDAIGTPAHLTALELVVSLAVTLFCGFYILRPPTQGQVLASSKWRRQWLWSWVWGRTNEEDMLEWELLNEPEPPFISEKSQYVTIGEKRLRIVHIIHELGNKVPLLVFIHGLGAQALQWEHQIEYFSQTTNVLAIDMVGCGKSDVVRGWSAYTTTSLLSDLTALLTTRYRSSSTVLIGHSYGCTLATLLSLTPTLRPSIRALVLLSPKAQFTPAQERSLRFVRWCPDWIVDAMRLRDRRGGTKSVSVDRLVGSEASEEVRRRQLRWNLASRTRVWRRMIAGVDRWVTKTEWEMVSVPVLLVGGKEDKVVPPHDMYEIRSCLLRNTHATLTATQVPPPFVIPGAGHQTMLEKPELVNPVALNFLNKSCGCEAMDPTWQILHKTRGENKWDLKNYEKWKRMPTISSTTIGPSLFRGMKVMRQTDPDHSPSAFLAKHPEVGYVINISHDSSPPYRPSDFDRSNVHYVKLGTVSKIPPLRNDVARFIECVKRCWGERPDVQIAVHCHYGFNRTGFVICCYLIEEMDVSVPDAIKYFAAARPPGIRHTHFKDELYLRYALPDRSETGDADGEV